MSIKSSLKTLLPFLFVLLWIPMAQAAPLGATDSITSPPVGNELLPGGNFQADDIRSSLIFARIIPFAINYTIGLAVALAVVFLIIGGYQYLTAQGESEKDEKARKTIMYAIIGLILSLTAYGIVQIVTQFKLS